MHIRIHPGSKTFKSSKLRRVMVTFSLSTRVVLFLLYKGGFGRGPSVDPPNPINVSYSTCQFIQDMPIN